PADSDLLEGESAQASPRERGAQHAPNVAAVEALRPFADEQQFVAGVERRGKGRREAIDEGADARRGELVGRKQDPHWAAEAVRAAPAERWSTRASGVTAPAVP